MTDTLNQNIYSESEILGLTTSDLIAKLREMNSAGNQADLLYKLTLDIENISYSDTTKTKDDILEITQNTFLHSALSLNSLEQKNIFYDLNTNEKNKVFQIIASDGKINNSANLLEKITDIENKIITDLNLLNNEDRNIVKNIIHTGKHTSEQDNILLSQEIGNIKLTNSYKEFSEIINYYNNYLPITISYLNTEQITIESLQEDNEWNGGDSLTLLNREYNKNTTFTLIYDQYALEYKFYKLTDLNTPVDFTDSVNNLKTGIKYTFLQANITNLHRLLRFSLHDLTDNAYTNPPATSRERSPYYTHYLEKNNINYNGNLGSTLEITWNIDHNILYNIHGISNTTTQLYYGYIDKNTWKSVGKITLEQGNISEEEANRINNNNNNMSLTNNNKYTLMQLINSTDQNKLKLGTYGFNFYDSKKITKNFIINNIANGFNTFSRINNLEYLQNFDVSGSFDIDNCVYYLYNEDNNYYLKSKLSEKYSPNEYSELWKYDTSTFRNNMINSNIKLYFIDIVIDKSNKYIKCKLQFENKATLEQDQSEYFYIRYINFLRYDNEAKKDRIYSKTTWTNNINDATIFYLEITDNNKDNKTNSVDFANILSKINENTKKLASIEFGTSGNQIFKTRNETKLEINSSGDLDLKNNKIVNVGGIVDTNDNELGFGVYPPAKSDINMMKNNITNITQTRFNPSEAVNDNNVIKTSLYADLHSKLEQEYFPEDVAITTMINFTIPNNSKIRSSKYGSDGSKLIPNNGKTLTLCTPVYFGKDDLEYNTNLSGIEGKYDYQYNDLNNNEYPSYYVTTDVSWETDWNKETPSNPGYSNFHYDKEINNGTTTTTKSWEQMHRESKAKHWYNTWALPLNVKYAKETNNGLLVTSWNEFNSDDVNIINSSYSGPNAINDNMLYSTTNNRLRYSWKNWGVRPYYTKDISNYKNSKTFDDKPKKEYVYYVTDDENGNFYFNNNKSLKNPEITLYKYKSGAEEILFTYHFILNLNYTTFTLHQTKYTNNDTTIIETIVDASLVNTGGQTSTLSGKTLSENIKYFGAEIINDGISYNLNPIYNTIGGNDEWIDTLRGFEAQNATMGENNTGILTLSLYDTEINDILYYGNITNNQYLQGKINIKVIEDINDNNGKNWIIPTKHNIRGTHVHKKSIISSGDITDYRYTSSYENLFKSGEVGTSGFGLTTPYIPNNEEDSNSCFYKLKRTEDTKIVTYQDAQGDYKASIYNINIFQEQSNSVETFNHNSVFSCFWNSQSENQDSGFVFAPGSNNPFDNDVERGLIDTTNNNRKVISDITRNNYIVTSHGNIDILDINIKDIDTLNSKISFDGKIRFNIVTDDNKRKNMYLIMGYNAVLGGGENCGYYSEKENKLDNPFGQYNTRYPVDEDDNIIHPNKIRNGSLVWLRTQDICDVSIVNYVAQELSCRTTTTDKGEYFYMSGVCEDDFNENTAEHVDISKNEIVYSTPNNVFQYYEKSLDFKDTNNEPRNIHKNKIFPWIIEFIEQTKLSNWNQIQQTAFGKTGNIPNNVETISGNTREGVFSGVEVRFYATKYNIYTKTYEKYIDTNGNYKVLYMDKTRGTYITNESFKNSSNSENYAKVKDNNRDYTYSDKLLDGKEKGKLINISTSDTITEKSNISGDTETSSGWPFYIDNSISTPAWNSDGGTYYFSKVDINSNSPTKLSSKLNIKSIPNLKSKNPLSSNDIENINLSRFRLFFDNDVGLHNGSKIMINTWSEYIDNANITSTSNNTNNNNNNTLENNHAFDNYEDSKVNTYQAKINHYLSPTFLGLTSEESTGALFGLKYSGFTLEDKGFQLHPKSKFTNDDIFNVSIKHDLHNDFNGFINDTANKHNKNLTWVIETVDPNEGINSLIYSNTPESDYYYSSDFTKELQKADPDHSSYQPDYNIFEGSYNHIYDNRFPLENAYATSLWTEYYEYADVFTFNFPYFDRDFLGSMIYNSSVAHIFQKFSTNIAEPYNYIKLMPNGDINFCGNNLVNIGSLEDTRNNLLLGFDSLTNSGSTQSSSSTTQSSSSTTQSSSSQSSGSTQGQNFRVIDNKYNFDKGINLNNKEIINALIQVNGSSIINNTITNSQISDTADISGSKIADGTITATKIADGAITAANFSTNDLDLSTIDKLTVNNIDIKGALNFEKSASSNRFKYDNIAIRLKLYAGRDVDYTNTSLGDSGAFSDDRLKINEKLFYSNSSDLLMKLRPQKYDKVNFKFDLSANSFNENLDLDASYTEFGLIAQELYTIPELRDLVGVPEDSDMEKIKDTKIYEGSLNEIQGYYEEQGWGIKTPAAINYQGLIPLLIKGFQEQQSILVQQKAALETQNATLETQTTRLETQNATLETQTTTLETQKATLETQNATLETQTTEIELQKQQHISSDNKITELTLQNSEKNIMIDVLKNENIELKGVNIELKNRLNIIEEILARNNIV